MDALARWGDIRGSSAWVRLRLLAPTHGAYFPILCDVPLHAVHDREVTLVPTLCTTKEIFISTNTLNLRVAQEKVGLSFDRHLTGLIKLERTPERPTEVLDTNHPTPRQHVHQVQVMQLPASIVFPSPSPYSAQTFFKRRHTCRARADSAGRADTLPALVTTTVCQGLLNKYVDSEVGGTNRTQLVCACTARCFA